MRAFPTREVTPFIVFAPDTAGFISAHTASWSGVSKTPGACNPCHAVEASSAASLTSVPRAVTASALPVMVLVSRSADLQGKFAGLMSPWSSMHTSIGIPMTYSGLYPCLSK